MPPRNPRIRTISIIVAALAAIALLGAAYVMMDHAITTIMMSAI